MQIFIKNIIIFLSDIAAIIYFFIKNIPVFPKSNRDKKKLRILLYHSVSAHSFHKDLNENNIRLDTFKQQMQILKKSSKKIVALNEGINSLKRGNLLHDSIAITFDDGMENVYKEALKILEDLNIPAAFFIVYKYIDSNKEALRSDTDIKEQFMNWRMVYDLKEKGFEIGSHSYSHKRLTTLNDEDVYKEIIDAKKKFEEKGIPVKYFAYPYGFYGDFTEEIETFIKDAGYKACLTNIMGDNIAGDNLFGLKRTRISWRDNPFRFKMKINGAYDWVDALKCKLLPKDAI